jgi:formate hydrogenlyase transcriptional activator
MPHEKFEEQIEERTADLATAKEQRVASETTLEEQLRFERLLSNLSFRCNRVALDQLDLEIEHSLKQILEFFGVDRCFLAWVSEQKATWKITHAAFADGLPPIRMEADLPTALFPWVFSRIAGRKEVLSFTTLEKLPTAASIDKQSYREWGIRSFLYTPILVGEHLEYFMSITADRAECAWPEEYIPRLRLLGEIFVTALERRQRRLQLEDRLRFEMLLADISARFVNLPPDQIDAEIEDGQRRICELFGLDRSTLWQVSESEPGTMVLTHMHQPPGGLSTPERMDARDFFPWAIQKLTSGEHLAISKLADLPPEAARDREVWSSYGTKSTLVVPLSTGGGDVFGVLSFAVTREERDWQEPIVKRLRLVAELFANALARKRADATLRETERRLSLATDAAGTGLWIIELETNQVWVTAKTRELFQFPPDADLTYEDFLEAIDPGDREQVRRAIEQAFQSRQNLHLEYPLLLPGGSTRWILTRGQPHFKSTGEPDRVMGVSIDITERKRTQEAARESEAHYRLLAENVSDVIWRMDLEGHFTFISPSVFKLRGFTAEEAVQQSIDEALTSDSARRARGALKDQIEAVRRGERHRWYWQLEQPRKDGSTVWTEVSTDIILNAEGIPQAVLGVSRDITERKRMEEQLQEGLQEIEQLKQRLERENICLQEEIKLLADHTEMVGQGPAIKRVLAQLEQVARTDSTVLILGETGTGKELLARAIHRMSSRKDRPLVTVNCASLPPTLIESELFGREKGAYTGALTKMIGRFEIADGSTLFLDEIGEVPLDLQSKLLRVLEEGHFERLGSTKTLHVNVRIIAATNREIAQDVKEGKFRKDLFYRLNVFPITVAPLRERREDIPLMVWAFVKEFQRKMGKEIESISRKTMEALLSYSWPGNVRELRNAIEHAMIVSSGKTLVVPLPELASWEANDTRHLEDMERRHIVSVLEGTSWRVAGKDGAAEVLGLKRSTLYSKMKKLGIHRPDS